MNLKTFALLLLLGMTVSSCRSGIGPAPPPPPPGPGPGTGTSNPPPNPNPARPTPPPVPTAPPPAQAQYTPAATSPPPAAAIPDQPPASTDTAGVATRAHADILKLKQAGFSEEFLLSKIRVENVNFQLTTTEILDLRAAGLSEAVLETMLRSGRSQASAASALPARKAEFAGLARVGKRFLGVFGTSTKDIGRLVVDGETVSWFQTEDPEGNFSLYLKNIKEVFNTCVLRPGQNLCLEFGFVTYTGEQYRFRDPGWKNGENRLVTEATAYFRQAFPNLFFTQREESKL